MNDGDEAEETGEIVGKTLSRKDGPPEGKRLHKRWQNFEKEEEQQLHRKKVNI